LHLGDLTRSRLASLLRRTLAPLGLNRARPATENGKPVKKSKLELFISAVVKDGITKGTPSKALVLYFIQRLAARELA
jgi:hypothetical protein